jgi:hypothetical protein
MEWIDPDKWSRWSDYFWLLFVLLNMVKVHFELQRVMTFLSTNRSNTDGKVHRFGATCAYTNSAEISALQEELLLLRLQQCRNLFYLPNAVHWAMKKPLLTDTAVATFGFAEAVIGFAQAWRAQL